MLNCVDHKLFLCLLSLVEVMQMVPTLTCIVNKSCYILCAGIPPHVETHSAFEDVVIVVNLQSQVI